MAEVPGSSGSLTPDDLGVSLDAGAAVRARATPLPSANAAHHKSVRFGTHEPALLTLTRGQGGQNAIGRGVVGGMISATVLAIFFVPVFFVVVKRLFRQDKPPAPPPPAAAG